MLVGIGVTSMITGPLFRARSDKRLRASTCILAVSIATIVASTVMDALPHPRLSSSLAAATLALGGEALLSITLSNVVIASAV